MRGASYWPYMEAFLPVFTHRKVLTITELVLCILQLQTYPTQCSRWLPPTGHTGQPPDITADTTVPSLCPPTGRDVLSAAVRCSNIQRAADIGQEKSPRVPCSLQCQTQKLMKGKLASINCKNESAGQRACSIWEQVYCPRGDAS